MDAARRHLLIQRYDDGARAIAVAIETLAEQDLDRVPVHPGWSAREIIHHLAEIIRPASRDWTARQLIHHLADAELFSDAHLGDAGRVTELGVLTTQSSSR